MYRIEYSKNAFKIKFSSKKEAEKIIDKIESKLKHFSHKTTEVKYLKAYGIYRLRIGDIRVGFEKVDDLIIVKSIQRRDKAYKNKS